ncbi:hypothetical protein ACFPK9_11520 [Rubritalea spongiae]|uniref:Cardiolipin synthase N-terminal domain-containing protein n=1 Tax=Rubritalea spongiae TaxID=430797 RepID=A0ABW5DZ31_9BACT
MISNLNIACTTCANAFEKAGDNAAGYAILFMLCLLIPILGTLGFVIFRIARRSKANFDPQFQDPYEA